MTLSKTELADLKRAKQILEHPGLAARFAVLLGSPLEKGMKMLPSGVQKTIHKATETALMKALSVAVSSLGENRRLSGNRLHTVAAAATGAAASTRPHRHL